MGRIVFLVEERSMEVTLRSLLPKVFPHWQEQVHWLTLTHRGKSDLEKSIPVKLRGWSEPNDRFVILRDNDGGDCHKRKESLRELCCSKAEEAVLIRIVCQELESWFLGDLAAIKAAFPRAPIKLGKRPAKFRNPDNLTNAAQELAAYTRTKAKVSTAESIARELQPDLNQSVSFQIFLSGLRRLVADAW